MRRDASEDLSDATESHLMHDRKEGIGTIRGSRGGIEPHEKWSFDEQNNSHDIQVME